MVALQENTREWYQEMVRLGHLIEAWGGDPAKDLPPKAIWESMQKLGIIVPKP